jgi:predicted ATPase
MLKSIRLVNFYSFRDTTIELNRGANVLVGINGSGKSNFLKVFELLNEAFNGRGLRRYILEIGGVNELLYQGERYTEEILIEIEFDTSEFNPENTLFPHTFYSLKIIPSLTEYFLEEKIGQKNNSSIIKRFKTDNYDIYLEPSLNYENESNENFNILTSFIKTLSLYLQFDTRIEAKIRKPNLSIPERSLKSDGSNLTQVLNTIKINDKKTYRKIIEALQRVNPYFKDFDFRPFGTNFEMLLEEEGLNRSIHLSKVSDGTLRYLCLVTALMTNKNSVLCIDEPETGLHPDMLFNIAQAIKEAGETSTVIISTHSAQLLNYFDLENVRVFEKDEENATQVYAYTERDFKGWYETFQVGNMWRQGDIGGNRYGN